MEIFNFELEQKIDHHSSVEFHGESNGCIFKAQKLNYNSLIALIDLNMTSKIEIFNFGLEQKINHPLRVKFHGESSGDNLNAQKLNYNTLIALIGPNYKIWKFRLVYLVFASGAPCKWSRDGANTAL